MHCTADCDPKVLVAAMKELWIVVVANLERDHYHSIDVGRVKNIGTPGSLPDFLIVCSISKTPCKRRPSEMKYVSVTVALGKLNPIFPE